MRLLKTMLVLAVLIGLPLGSWLYLRNGLMWRKHVLQELEQKHQFNGLACMVEDIPLDTAFFRGNLWLVHRQAEGVSDSTLLKLIGQFEDRNDMFFVIADPDSALTSSSRSGRIVTLDSGQSAACKGSLDSLLGAGRTSVLIDNEGNVRHAYNLKKMEDVKALVTHIAVLLPMEKREKLELRHLQESENGN